MFGKIRDLAERAGLVTNDDDGTPPPASPPPPAVNSGVSASSTPQPSVVQPSSFSSMPSYLGAADPEMVASIKNAVLKASPVLAVFMANCELMMKAFPHDESARMKAALAMTQGADKNALLSEMQSTVAAALAHAKAGAESEHTQERTRAVGALESKLESLNADIAAIESEITRLGKSVVEKRTAMVQLQNDIQTAEGELQKQDAKVKASFTEVERMLALLSQTFNQL